MGQLLEGMNHLFILKAFEKHVTISGDDDPDLSEKELKEIGLLLLRHAMATSKQTLAASILSRFFLTLLPNSHC